MFGLSKEVVTPDRFASPYGFSLLNLVIIKDVGWFIFIGMISFVGLLTVGGLVYMSWKLCDCSCCCLCLKDLEKKDVNRIYGDYYYSDGERRAGDMEVFLRNPSKS